MYLFLHNDGQVNSCFVIKDNSPQNQKQTNMCINE